MKQQPSRPTSFDGLQRAIVESFPSLSKRLQQIASYALENPSDLALETIATVAQRGGVQPSSLIRFAKVFGFSGYTDMQRVFRLRLTDAMPDYQERFRILSGAHSDDLRDGAALLSRFVEADTLGLQRLCEQRRLGALVDQAIQMLASTDSVYLVAHRRSFPVAFYLSYALSQMGVRNVLVDGVGGLFLQQASQATPRDVVFAISTKSYSPDVVQVVRESAQRGVRVIALTDSPLSPLVEHASISLEVQQASLQMFRSLAVPMTLAVTLIVGLGRVLDERRATATRTASSSRALPRGRGDQASGFGKRRSRTKPTRS
jgi:DNA-binding MurR/RpiR family transcriptional regulator